jgi:hypothetical protein
VVAIVGIVRFRHIMREESGKRILIKLSVWISGDGRAYIDRLVAGDRSAFVEAEQLIRTDDIGSVNRIYLRNGGKKERESVDRRSRADTALASWFLVSPMSLSVSDYIIFRILSMTQTEKKGLPKNIVSGRRDISHGTLGMVWAAAAAATPAASATERSKRASIAHEVRLGPQSGADVD